MTIAGRNKILVLGICVSTLLAIGGIGCCIVLTAHNTLAAFPTPARSAVWILRQPLFAYNQYAALLGVVSFPLVALILLIYIFFCLKKRMRWKYRFSAYSFLPFRSNRSSCFFRYKNSFRS